MRLNLPNLCRSRGQGWGFGSIRSWLSACRRRVMVLMTPFPRLGGAEIAVRGGVAAKLQTQWVTTAKIGAFGGMALHFGGFGVILGVLYECEPLNMRVNPLIRTQTPRHTPGRRCSRACPRAHVRVKGPRCMSSDPRVHKGARVRRMRSQKQKWGLKGLQASRCSPCFLGYASRCVLGPRSRHRKVTPPATRRVL